MSDHYNQLTETEQAYWDVYTRLRELSDWEGFTDGQDDARQAARDWLVNQRKFIWRCAEGKVDGYKPGWDTNNRSERYAQLADDNLNIGTCRRVCQLPTNGETPSEKAKTSEREMWWLVSSVDDQTKTWRENNAAWLTERRKKVWHLGESEGWSEADRRLRYDNLCIATKTGSPYETWADTHNPQTGETVDTTSPRERAVANARKYLGVSENPPESNRGSPQPDDWCRRVYGDTGVPWCACFATCMAWDAGVTGSSSAAVQYIISMAKSGQGMYRGWTTNPNNVLRGDLAVIGCSTCHIGMAVDSNDPYHTIEGNTSPGTEGSQYNGGCVAEKHRPHGDIIGWALVDYPG